MKKSIRQVMKMFATLAMAQTLNMISVLAPTDSGFFGLYQVRAQDLNLNVKKFELKNGMRVLLHKDNAIPMVAVHQWYNVGSFDEDPQRTGLAHFFEHLMFKGTKNFPSGAFDDIITNLGGSNNAFTTRDYTGYHEVLPSAGLKKVLELESDRMVHLLLDEDEIQKEREVVKEERRMRVENSPGGLAFESLLSMTFKGHPYEWPVIGSMEHLNATTMDNFRDFYKKYYAPNNSVLVIVGDIDLGQVESWVKKYYEKIPRSHIEKKISPQIPVQNARRFLRVNKFDNRMLGVFFLAPGAGDRDAYALDILAEALGGGENGRLHKLFVDQMQSASGVEMWNYTLRNYGALGLMVNISGKKPFESIEKSFFAEIQKVQNQGLSEIELKRVKDRFMLDYVNSLTTNMGKARVLASNEILMQDYKSFLKDLKIYESITNDDIVRVSKKYLSIPKSNVIYLGQ